MATSKNRTSLPPLGPFTGFPAEGVSFFRALAMNQRREWFQENRAAFDFLAGTTRQAPRWVMRSGLEWLFRLLAEPRRLWRRYLVFNSLFVWHLLRDAVRR